MTEKIAVLVLAEMDQSHQDMGRVTNALQVAQEFKEAGDEVEIIFDGGGAVTAVLLADPEHQMHKLYQNVADNVTGVCRFCARAFEVYDKAEELGLPFLSEYKQHPSVRRLIVNGFQVLTF